METILPYFLFMDLNTNVLNTNKIDDLDCSILRKVTEYSSLNKKIRVGDLLETTKFGSQPTIHTYIKKLIKENFLVVESDVTDGRVKYLLPTTKTLEMFDKLNQGFLDICKK